MSEVLRKAAGVSDAEKLRSLASRIRVIGSDCFDLGAAGRLRILADEVEKMARSADS